ncbi:MAG TPA: hypothetical protein VM163_06570 [bacterium]|nr:hypothetical protein [bacterium]
MFGNASYGMPCHSPYRISASRIYDFRILSEFILNNLSADPRI